MKSQLNLWFWGPVAVIVASVLLLAPAAAHRIARALRRRYQRGAVPKNLWPDPVHGLRLRLVLAEMRRHGPPPRDGAPLEDYEKKVLAGLKRDLRRPT